MRQRNMDFFSPDLKCATYVKCILSVAFASLLSPLVQNPENRAFVGRSYVCKGGWRSVVGRKNQLEET